MEDGYDPGHAGPDEETMRQAEESARSDCNTAYSIIDELVDQLFEAAGELRTHKMREHGEIHEVLDNIKAAVLVKHLIWEFVDPDESEEDPHEEYSDACTHFTPSVGSVICFNCRRPLSAHHRTADTDLEEDR